LLNVHRNLFQATSGTQNPTNILVRSYLYDLANRRTFEQVRTVDSQTSFVTRNTTTNYDSDGRAILQATMKSTNGAAAVNESRVSYGTGRATWDGSNWSLGFDDANNLRGYEVQFYNTNGGTAYRTTYKNNYYLFDGYVERSQTATSTGSGSPDPGGTERTYNVNHELIKFTDQEDAERTRYFASNQAGQVLTTIQTDADNSTWFRSVDRFWDAATSHTIHDQLDPGTRQYFYYANNQQVGAYGLNGDREWDIPHFDVNSTPISENYPASTPTSVYAQEGDTLRLIAARVFGDPALWYVLAEENGLSDPDAVLTAGMQIRVPNSVTSLSNTADSFKPFNIADALGDTTPTQPPPPVPKGCGVIGMIIMIVVAIVVTYFTAGAAAGWLGTMWGAATSATASFAAAVVGGAIGGAAGSIASQGVGIAIGAQDKFDWKGVAQGAIGGAVGGALFGVQGFDGYQGLLGGETLAGVSRVVGKTASPYVQAGIRSAASSVLTQGISMAVGLQSSFNWNQVAAAAASGMVGHGASKVVSPIAGKIGGSVGGVIQRTATGITSSVAYTLVTGGKIDYAIIAADAFGNALGNSIVDGIQTADVRRHGLPASSQDGVEPVFGPRTPSAMTNLGSGAERQPSTSGEIDPETGEPYLEIVVEGRAPVSDLALNPLWISNLAIKDRPYGATGGKRFETHNTFVNEHMRLLANVNMTSAYAYDTSRGFEEGGWEAVEEMTGLLSTPSDREALAILAGLDPEALASASPAQQMLMVAEGTARSLEVAYELGRHTMAAGMGHNAFSLEARFLDLYANNFQDAGSLSLFAAVANGTPVGLAMSEGLRPMLQQDVNSVALAAFAGLVPRSMIGDVEAYATNTLFGAYAEHMTPLIGSVITGAARRIPGLKRVFNASNAVLEDALKASLARTSRLLYGFTPKALAKTGSVARRLMYAGKTPGKATDVGLEVQAEMMRQGRLKDFPDGQRMAFDPARGWRPISEFDMGHKAGVDVVHYWNTFGRYTGARSTEMRDFMNNPASYELMHRSVNRSGGAKLRAQYLEPASSMEISLWRQRHRN
jgi:hypothetical protein